MATRRELLSQPIDYVKSRASALFAGEIQPQLTIPNPNLTRGEFLKLLIATPLLVTACSKPSEPSTVSLPARPDVPEIHTVDTWCQQFGGELNNWTLVRGIPVVSINKEARQAADLLIGKTDPRVYMPQVQVPLELFTDNSVDGALDLLDFVENEADPRKVTIELPSGRTSEFNWVNKIIVAFTLSDEVRNSSARVAVMAKEASQFVDFPEYARLYVELAKKLGVKVRLNNPTNVLTSDRELAINIAYRLQGMEEKAEDAHSFFADFIDYGSFLRVGGILLGNWLQDNYNRGQATPDTGFIRNGSKSAGYLQKRNFFTRRDDGAIVWASGKAPEGEELLELYKQYTQRENPRFK